MTINEIEKMIPRSDEYNGKTIAEIGFVIIEGTYYFKRIFFDGCSELVRYDSKTRKWIVLIFTNIMEPD